VAAQEKSACGGWKELKKKKTKWPESASELYHLNDRRLSAKLVPTFADRGCHMGSVMDSYDCILGLSRLEPLLFLSSSSLSVLKRLGGPHSRPLLLRKSGSAGNRTQTSGSVARNSDH
jgi:hypothetical protein